MSYKIVQLCPRLNTGGVERGVVDVAIYLKEHGYESIVISNGGKLIDELTSKQVRHISLPIHSKNPFVFIVNLWRLNRELQAIKPDLILPYSRIPTWLIYFLRKKTRVPYITHCLGIHQMGMFGLKKLYNSVMIRSPWIIANSEFTKTYFANTYQIDSQNVNVISRSVDLDYFDERQVSAPVIQRLKEQWRTPSQKTVILLPARLTSWKGHEVLIRAMALIKKQKGYNFYAVLIGNCQDNSSYYNRLLKLIDELALSDDIFFTESFVNIRDAYAAADVVVSTSTEPEAFGRTIIEAQAMGKLIIASQHGGALETIEDNVTGYLVRPGDVRALADKLIYAQEMSEPEKLELSEWAKKNAQRYSKENMCRQSLTLYDQVIELS